MKAGTRHRVPLSQRSIEILQALRALHPDHRYQCPGRKPGRPLSNMAFEMAMRRLGSTATPHGFRSSFRDWAAEQTGHSHEVIERTLAHTIKSKTERAYNRSDLFERRRQLMADWAAFVTGGAL